MFMVEGTAILAHMTMRHERYGLISVMRVSGVRCNTGMDVIFSPIDVT
jgi:hypothetical protein